MKVVTRFAPSPTGYLHIGGARTALFNYLFAKHHGGTYKLRVEDTDEKRNTPEAVQAIFDGLSWLGIEHDGKPVFQSARADRHREIVNQMLDTGHAYRCYVPLDTLTKAREQARAERRHFQFESPWRDRAPSDDWFQQLEAPPSYVVRLKAPREGETVIEDSVQGRVVVQNNTLDDMILLRSDGTPTYMLAVVVDDIDMGVTHVIRGDDHLNNAFRQAQIYHALGAKLPVYAHIPLIHDEKGAKYSKRSGAVAVGDFADKGILSDAMINYLVKLGWGHGDDEIISRAQMIEWFDLPSVNRGPSRFDEKKLLSLNAHYLREASDDVLFEALTHGLFPTLDLVTPDAPPRKFLATPLEPSVEKMLRDAIPSLKPRAQTVVEMIDMARFYVERPFLKVDYDFPPLIARFPTAFDRTGIEQAFRDHAEATNQKLKDVVAPARLAITGSKVSPPLFEAMELLGRDEVVSRLYGFVDRPPHRFVFEFHHEDHPEGDDAIFVYFFPFLQGADKVRQLNDEDDEIIDFTGEMEDYGIHDFGTSGNYELVGYHSYEIKPDDWMTVVEKWRDWFTERGVVCGEIEVLPHADYQARFFQ